MSESSTLAIAVRNLVREIPAFMDSFYAFAWDVLTTIIIPVGSMITVSIITWKISREIWRILFPPPAAVFHKCVSLIECNEC